MTWTGTEEISVIQFSGPSPSTFEDSTQSAKFKANFRSTQENPLVLPEKHLSLAGMLATPFGWKTIGLLLGTRSPGLPCFPDAIPNPKGLASVVRTFVWGVVQSRALHRLCWARHHQRDLLTFEGTRTRTSDVSFSMFMRNTCKGHWWNLTQGGLREKQDVIRHTTWEISQWDRWIALLPSIPSLEMFPLAEKAFPPPRRSHTLGMKLSRMELGRIWLIIQPKRSEKLLSFFSVLLPVGDGICLLCRSSR